jgi:hypothetical protein
MLRRTCTQQRDVILPSGAAEEGDVPKVEEIRTQAGTTVTDWNGKTAVDLVRDDETRAALQK